MAERRLFFALWPDDRQREALRDPVKAALSPIEGRAVERGNWHVTLVFLGNLPEERIAALAEAAAEIVVEPFRLRFDRLDFWPRPRIACLTATSVPPELQSLVSQLEDAAAPFGYQADGGYFRPHITLLRRARPFTPQPLAQPVILEWSGFALMESVSSARGVQYRPLKQRVRRNS